MVCSRMHRGIHHCYRMWHSQVDRLLSKPNRNHHASETQPRDCDPSIWHPAFAYLVRRDRTARWFAEGSTIGCSPASTGKGALPGALISLSVAVIALVAIWAVVGFRGLGSSGPQCW